MHLPRSRRAHPARRCSRGLREPCHRHAHIHLSAPRRSDTYYYRSWVGRVHRVVSGRNSGRRLHFKDEGELRPVSGSRRRSTPRGYFCDETKQWCMWYVNSLTVSFFSRRTNHSLCYSIQVYRMNGVEVLGRSVVVYWDIVWYSCVLRK